MDKQELKVLLIEDNAGDAFLIKFYLGESMSPKFDFHHAENMKTANELLAANTFDIILMDLNLPDSVGLDTIKKLLEKYPSNLVIVLTGLVDEKVGLETVRYGAQDFLVKGKFDGKVLISSIMFAFERFNLNKQLSNVSSALNTGEDRFNNIQMLVGAGYLEADLQTRMVYLSPHLLKLFNLPADKQYQTVDECKSYLVDPETVAQQTTALWSNKDVSSISIKHKLYPDGNLKFKWLLIGDTKLIGVVYPE
jgi:DNA-binding response OmpR family regulator